METKRFLKVVFFLVTYLACSLATNTYHGCGEIAEKTMKTNMIGEASRNEFGNKEKKVIFSLGRKLASGPSRRGCGH
ncbi:hypothetical protein N665_0209s0027 [Sinapis alba]|nr:hypothetical protein N665_0209s0027 [Sinapis alba]